jgi:hypothetical protein
LTRDSKGIIFGSREERAMRKKAQVTLHVKEFQDGRFGIVRSILYTDGSYEEEPICNSDLKVLKFDTEKEAVEELYKRLR